MNKPVPLPLARAAQSQALFTDPNMPAKPIVARHGQALPNPVEPYSSIVILDCDDCGGTGADMGTRDDYEPCEFCGGTREQAVLRNWLGEAFQIEAGQLRIEPQREHLQALRYYATQLVNAMNEPLARDAA